MLWYIWLPNELAELRARVADWLGGYFRRSDQKRLPEFDRRNHGSLSDAASCIARSNACCMASESTRPSVPLAE